jgi:hypothetical protein
MSESSSQLSLSLYAIEQLKRDRIVYYIAHTLGVIFIICFRGPSDIFLIWIRLINRFYFFIFFFSLPNSTNLIQTYNRASRNTTAGINLKRVEKNILI